MKKLVFLLLLTTASFSQNLNDYRYAIVASRFEFQKEKDQFRLNTLSKLFMEKYGFETYFDTDILPANFANNNCSKVFLSVETNNNFSATKVKVILKDCKNSVIAISQEGSSKEKDLKVAYDQALRQAFSRFPQVINHKYNGIETPVLTVEKEIITNVSTTAETGFLYAQSINNGFQFVNSEPKVIMKIYKTSVKDFYIAIKGTTQGVLFSRNNEWFFEFYQNDKLFSEKVEVKF